MSKTIRRSTTAAARDAGIRASMPRAGWSPEFWRSSETFLQREETRVRQLQRKEFSLARHKLLLRM